jgi:hypothetical protein
MRSARDSDECDVAAPFDVGYHYEVERCFPESDE